MTPMIDCTFLLIIFFILAGQMASESLAHVELPDPEQSQAVPSERMDRPDKAIVNVIYATGEGEEEVPALIGKASRYQVGGVRVEPGDVDSLKGILERMKADSGSGEFSVEIRADERVDYADVFPVMQAAAAAKITKMNITALAERER
jgi:biopolymer transport protein ExbD